MKKLRIRIKIVSGLILLLMSSGVFAESLSFGVAGGYAERKDCKTFSADQWLVQEMTQPLFHLTSDDFLTMNSGLLRANSGNEEDFGTNTSGNSNIYFANDVPLGDGMLPLMIVALFWSLLYTLVRNKINLQTIKTTNKMRKTMILTLLMLLSIAGIHAQVTVGSDIAPTVAALLELKSQQTPGKPDSAIDPINITSDAGGGGLLLPRVMLVDPGTLQPFLPATGVSDSLKFRLAGLMVYNLKVLSVSGTDVLWPSVCSWDGSKWVPLQPNTIPALIVTGQPEPFTFYEKDAESVSTDPPLTFLVSGGKAPITYQWYQVTGNNVHVRVGTPISTFPAVAGTGATTPNLRPTGIRKTNGILSPASSTRDARNTGFYRFYCVATDAVGQRVESKIAEVAVGCGAKNNDGEWFSFMCFNLGAEHNISINEQITRSLVFQNDSVTGLHPYTTGEDALYGELFQWGRIADGHQSRTSGTYAYNTPVTNTPLAAGDFGSGNRCTTTGQVLPENQIKTTSGAYTKFITNSNTSPYNWYFTTGTPPDNLWRTGRFFANDPCAHYQPADGQYKAFWNGTGGSVDNTSPACTDTGNAWRIPTQAEWGELYRGGTHTGDPANATANTWVWNNATNGYTSGLLNLTKSGGFKIIPDGDGGSDGINDGHVTLYLPATGYRSYSSASPYYQGTDGLYWSSTVTGTNAYCLNFSSGTIYPAYSTYRASGFALRCIKNL